MSVFVPLRHACATRSIHPAALRGQTIVHRGVSEVCVVADDLGCAMIPPQSEEEVGKSCDALRARAEEVGTLVADKEECTEIAAGCAAMQRAVELLDVSRLGRMSAAEL